MSSFAKFEVNEIEFNRLMARLSKKVADFRPAFGLISGDFYKDEKQIFGLKSAGKYKDLKPATKKYKLKNYGFIYPILFATGKLGNSLMNPNAPDAVHEEGKKSLVLGTDVEYGIYHQSDKPRKKIPLRKFLFMDDARAQRWSGYLLANAIKQGEDVLK